MSYSAKSIVKAIVFILVHLLSDQEIQLTLHLRSHPLQPSHPSFKASASSTERIKIFICFFECPQLRVDTTRRGVMIMFELCALGLLSTLTENLTRLNLQHLDFFKQSICKLNCSAIGVLEVVYKLVPTNVEFKLG